MPKTHPDANTAEWQRRLGRHIRAARDKAGLTQRALAAKIDVQPSTLSDWERGRYPPSLENLKAISRTTQESVSFLLSDGLHGDGLEASGRALVTRLGHRRASLILQIPETRLRNMVDQLLGTYVSEGGELRRRTRPRQPSSRRTRT